MMIGHLHPSESKLSSRKRSLFVILIALGLLAVPTMAGAQSSDDAAAEEEIAAENAAPAAVVTIPVLGSDLVVTISVDDEGTLSEVALDPADGFTMDAEHDHKMKFTSDDGSMVVKVKAKNDNIFTKVEAQDVESLAGPGTWTGDVFGTGDIATVHYVISVDAAGMPAVTVDDSIDFALPDVAIDIKQGESEIEEADEAESTAKVTFERDGDKVQLKITAEIQMQDGESRISLKIMLIGGGNSGDAADADDADDKDKSDKSEKKDKKEKKPNKEKSDGKDDSDDNSDSDSDVVDRDDKDDKSDDHRKDD